MADADNITRAVTVTLTAFKVQAVPDAVALTRARRPVEVVSRLPGDWPYCVCPSLSWANSTSRRNAS